jgi:small subunit ribosomal protein S2
MNAFPVESVPRCLSQTGRAAGFGLASFCPASSGPPRSRRGEADGLRRSLRQEIVGTAAEAAAGTAGEGLDPGASNAAPLREAGPVQDEGDIMGLVSARDLIAAGCHFGHQSSRWNPKMARYIWGKRNKIHVIDIRETIRGIVEAYHFLRAAAAGGGKFLFVGTKRQAKEVVRNEAARTGMYFVSERWLGGALTNLPSIRTQVGHLKELELIETDGTLETYSKKMIASFNREKRKIVRNLDGIRNMEGLPTSLIVVDPRRERIAVEEAFKLRIPIVAILDTDCDPDPIDIPIPANDDAIRAIELVIGYLGRSIIEGRLAGGYPVPKEALIVADGQAGEAGGQDAREAEEEDAAEAKAES